MVLAPLSRIHTYKTQVSHLSISIIIIIIIIGKHWNFRVTAVQISKYKQVDRLDKQVKRGKQDLEFRSDATDVSDENCRASDAIGI